jgi:hypothetical protein
MTGTTLAPEQIDRALRLVASRRLAATSALQRWMRISFRDADALLNELQQRGYVGPAEGSKSRDVHARYCEQCGRIGKRGFRTLTSEKYGIEITVCSNRDACRKRRPEQPRDDD